MRLIIFLLLVPALGFPSPCFEQAKRFISISSDTDSKLKVSKVYSFIEKLSSLNDLNIHVEQLGLHDGYPIHAITLKKNSNSSNPRKRVLVTAGIHGNEPISTLTAVELIESYMQSSMLQDNFEFTIIPMLNPGGLAKGTRADLSKIDLNRTFLIDQEYSISLYIKNFLARNLPFDMSLDLHVDRTN